jgi:hypothetical protein
MEAAIVESVTNAVGAAPSAPANVVKTVPAPVAEAQRKLPRKTKSGPKGAKRSRAIIARTTAALLAEIVAHPGQRIEQTRGARAGITGRREARARRPRRERPRGELPRLGRTPVAQSCARSRGMVSFGPRRVDLWGEGSRMDDDGPERGSSGPSPRSSGSESASGGFFPEVNLNLGFAFQ